MVRGQLAALLRLAPAAPAGREDDGGGVDDVVAAAGAPAVLRAFEIRQRRLRERRDGRSFDRLAQRRRDRVAGAVADLQKPLPRRAAAAGEAISTVVARELDAE